MWEDDIGYCVKDVLNKRFSWLADRLVSKLLPDPKILLSDEKKILSEAKKYLDIFKGLPYIFNLGHGLLPETDPDKVEKLIKFFREYQNEKWPSRYKVWKNWRSDN